MTWIWSWSVLEVYTGLWGEFIRPISKHGWTPEVMISWRLNQAFFLDLAVVLGSISWAPRSITTRFIHTHKIHCPKDRLPHLPIVIRGSMLESAWPQHGASWTHTINCRSRRMLQVFRSWGGLLSKWRIVACLRYSEVQCGNGTTSIQILRFVLTTMSFESTTWLDFVISKANCVTLTVLHYGSDD